jgi:hypothetical protein
MQRGKLFTYITLFVLLVCSTGSSFAQSLLDKRISIDMKKKPLKDVLKYIGKQGDFSFSYKSDLLREDSIVSLTINNSVRYALDQLFAGRYEYKETSNHIIIQTATPYWYVSGYVVDELTGERIMYASVYDKQQLVTSLTDEHGYFKLKLKERAPTVISVSKSWYADASMTVKPGADENLTLRIVPKSFELDSVTVSSKTQLEKNWLANMFLSSKQRMQSLNLNQFFVDMPYQASVIPGLSTHGKMSAQVVNKFSFNLLGGYTAGVNGFEIAGVFNMVKHNVRYAQIAGAFNITGGSVNGLQIAGAYNGVLDSANGLLIAGVANTTAGSVTGAQISGAYNHTLKDMDGVQISGFGNYTRGKLDGTQIAGFGNIAGKEVNGVQISGFFNYAKKLDGTQIGIINIADTSTGYSIGLINLIFKGYHKLAISSNEVVNFNAAFKTGSNYLYSILTAGYNIGTNATVFSFGYGLGTNAQLNKRLSINPEVTIQHLYLGDWNKLNLLLRTEINLQYKVWKFITVHAGPAFSMYYSKPATPVSGFKSEIPGNYIAPNKMSTSMSNWFGWNIGINFF